MLPGIVKLPLPTVRLAFLRIAVSGITAGAAALMTPSDLFVDVMRLEFRGVPKPTLLKVVDLFFDRRDRNVYSQQVRSVRWCSDDDCARRVWPPKRGSWAA